MAIHLSERLNKFFKKHIMNRVMNCEPEDNVPVFSNLMSQGKIKAAVKFLSKEGDSGVLGMNDNVFNELQKKHAKRKHTIKLSSGWLF